MNVNIFVSVTAIFFQNIFLNQIRVSSQTIVNAGFAQFHKEMVNRMEFRVAAYDVSISVIS